jgi:hypothetical protein
MIEEPQESIEGTLAWISMDQVFSLPLVEDLYQLLPKVLKTTKHSSIFSALYTYDEYEQLIVRFSE